MQERRMLSFIDLGDIPSSASIPEVGDTCNVIYVPVCGDYQNFVCSSPSNNKILSIEPFSNVNLSYTCNGSDITINNSYIYFRTSGNNIFQLWFCLAGRVFSGSTTKAPVGGDFDVASTQFLGYLKIKFLFNVEVKSLGSYINPFYIDTEE